MELDDLKNTWNELSDQANEKQTINIQTINKMTKKKIYAHLTKIILPEIAGSIVCIACAVYIVFNFYRLNSIAFQVTGILSILLLLGLPVLSLLSIQQLYKAGDPSHSYADNLKEFTIQKIKFCKLQKLNLTLSYLLMVTVLILTARLFGRNEITDSKYFWIFSFSIGYIFLLFFSKWVFKSYNNTIKKTEALLKEL